MPGSRRAELSDSSEGDRSRGGTTDPSRSADVHQVPGSEEALGYGGTTPPTPGASSAPGRAPVGTDPAPAGLKVGTTTPVADRVRAERDAARAKAIDSLARGKLWMFGYHASKERQLSGILGESKPSPFASLVREARRLRRDSTPGGTTAPVATPAEQGGP